MVLLEFFKLVQEVNSIMCSLVYGKQWLVEIVFVLVIQFKVLLLDELVVGIFLVESCEFFEVIVQLLCEVIIVFIEYDMGLVFCFVECIMVLVGGKVLVEGMLVEIVVDQCVKEVYLGEVEYV